MIKTTINNAYFGDSEVFYATGKLTIIEAVQHALARYEDSVALANLPPASGNIPRHLYEITVQWVPDERRQTEDACITCGHSREHHMNNFISTGCRVCACQQYLKGEIRR